MGEVHPVLARKTPTPSPPENLPQAAISGKSHTLLLEYKKKNLEPDEVPGRQIS